MEFKKLFSVKNNRKYYREIKEIKKIITVLTASFLFLFLWANRTKLYPENILLYIENSINSFSIGGNEFPRYVDGEVTNFDNIKILAGHPVVLSNNSFSNLSKSGKILHCQKHNLDNPCFKTTGIRAIIYDVGGKDFKIESLFKNLHESTSEKNITSCDIGQNGTYAILTESQSYLSEMSIFNNSHEEKYKYYFSKIFATDIALNTKSDKCAVSGISFSDGNVNSDIYILNFKSEKPESIFKLENNIVRKVMYFTNGNVLAIGNNYLSVINLKLGNIKNFNYDHKLLKSYSFSKDYGICCCLSPSLDKGRDDEIVLVDTFGKSSKPIKTSENFRNIAHFKNRILGITNTKLLSYSIEGRFQGYLDLNNIFENIVAGSDNFVYAVGNSKIEKIKIKNLKYN